MDGADSFDCVVVGGGVIGACCAYELARAGVGTVALIEQGDLGGGTTRAYAGNVFMAAAGYIPQFGEEEYALESYGLNFYKELNDVEPGVGLHDVGSLFLAGTEEWAAKLADDFTNERTVPDQEVLDPGEVAKLCNKLQRNAIAGAVYHPNSGWVSARDASLALGRLIESAGGTVRPGTRVTALVTEAGRITGLNTLDGCIRTERVVLATGAWTNDLINDKGLRLPMIPVSSARIVAKKPPAPSGMPVILIKERGLYLRGDKEGMLWGGAYSAPPRFDILDARVPLDLNELVLDGILELIRKGRDSADVLPELAGASHLTYRYGAPCHTLDRRAMVGPIEAVPGLYFAGGCNEAGVMHAPGFGRLIAEQIAYGKARLTNAEVFAPGRFSTACDRESILKIAEDLFGHRGND